MGKIILNKLTKLAFPYGVGSPDETGEVADEV